MPIRQFQLVPCSCEFRPSFRGSFGTLIRDVDCVTSIAYLRTAFRPGRTKTWAHEKRQAVKACLRVLRSLVTTDLHGLARANRAGQTVVVVAVAVVPQRQAELQPLAQNLDLLRGAGRGVGRIE